MPDNDMTDERMDARLRRAGEAWRAGTDAVGTDAVGTDAAGADAAGTGPSGSGTDGPGPGADEVPRVPTGPVRRRRHHRSVLIASAAVVAAALVAAGALLIPGIGGQKSPAGGGRAGSLTGTVWRLVGYGDGQRLPNSTSTLHIGRDGQLVADDSCNLLGAHVDARNGRLDTTALRVRYKNCGDSVGEVTFTRAIKILQGDPPYALHGDELTIGDTIHLVAAPDLPVPSLDVPTLAGATWRLAHVADAAGGTHRVDGAQTLRITGTRLRASTGCFTLEARVGQSGRQIDVSRARATDTVPCPSTPAATASVVRSVLSGPTLRSQIRGTTLTLALSGAGTLTYDWVPGDPRASDPDSLTGTSWRLVSIAGRTSASRATLRIGSDGTVSGSDGCQRLRGRATVTTGAMTLTGMPSGPQSGCAGADDASTIDSFLTSTPVRWAVRNDQLLIFGGGAQGFSLVYVPIGPRSASSPTR